MDDSENYLPQDYILIGSTDYVMLEEKKPDYLIWRKAIFSQQTIAKLLNFAFDLIIFLTHFESYFV